MLISNRRIYHKAAVFLLAISYAFTVPAGFDINIELLEKIKAKYGDAASVRIMQWQRMMDADKGLSDSEKLARVNDFFNQRIDFIDDIYLWRVKDYWATPLEFLAIGAGDCEDYAISKYFTLIELGVPEEKMRITYVKALRLNQAHMVLTYFPTPRSVPLVLDNLIPDIKKANQRKDLLPVYSFNGSGLWLAKIRGGGERVGESSRLNMWRKLKQRMLKWDLQI